jgi:(2Fe-2S) ferredoxin
MPASLYYRYHVFFCVNQRVAGRACCANHHSQEVRDYAKARIKALGLDGPGGIRINTAGCMDRCEDGPVMVIYPEGTWYTYMDKEDIDEIIEKHLCHGVSVDRLKMKC